MIEPPRLSPTGTSWPTALAEAVADNLKAGIAERGTASLAVSGGSTPAKFFARARRRRTDVDWDKVIVTLVDERWVPETSDRSNAGLVNEKLLQGPAAAAQFVPLYAGGDEPDAAAIARDHRQRSRPCRARSTRWSSAWATTGTPPRSFPAATRSTRR